MKEPALIIVNKAMVLLIRRLIPNASLLSRLPLLRTPAAPSLLQHVYSARYNPRYHAEHKLYPTLCHLVCTTNPTISESLLRRSLSLVLLSASSPIRISLLCSLLYILCFTTLERENCAIQLYSRNRSQQDRSAGKVQAQLSTYDWLARTRALFEFSDAHTQQSRLELRMGLLAELLTTAR